MKRLRWACGGVGLGALTFLAACSDLSGAPPVAVREAPLIGGRPDTATRGVVGLVVEQMSGCTGSLIAPNLVLTARHCVASINSATGTVTCGVTNFGSAFPPGAFVVTPDDNLRDGVPAGAQYSVQRVVTTPGNGVCGNDVSLLVLDENIPSSTSPLIVPRIDAAPAANEGFDAVGYGITNPDDAQGVTFGQRLRVDDLNVMCVGTACTSLGGTRTEWGAVTPVCSGDSGGPALDTAGRVIGVASRGDEECRTALYGSVASWRSLIVETAIDAATSGGYAPPGWTNGTTTDAGPPDSGAPDGGTAKPDGGSVEPDGGAPKDGGVPDAGGIIGTPCDGSCEGGLACYQVNEARGICVPPCSAGNTACPSGYECSVRVGVCVPEDPDDGDDDRDDDDDPDNGGDCACRAAPRPARPGTWFLAFLTGLAFVARRRRSLRGFRSAAAVVLDSAA